MTFYPRFSVLAVSLGLLVIPASCAGWMALSGRCCSPRRLCWVACMAWNW